MTTVQAIFKIMAQRPTLTLTTPILRNSDKIILTTTQTLASMEMAHRDRSI